MQSSDNPLLAAMNTVAGDDDKKFDPNEEVGVNDRHFMEFLAQITGEFLAGKAQAVKQDGTAEITEEDLMYLVAIGTCVGVQYQKDRVE